MYNSYAKSVGFSTRKSTTRYRADKTLYQKHIVCSNRGQCGQHSSHETVNKNATTKTWLQKFVLDHNHYLVSPNKAHKLRSHRHIIDADKQLIAQIREAGIQPTQVYEFFKRWYGGAENVPFSRMDCNNLIGHEDDGRISNFFWADGQAIMDKACFGDVTIIFGAALLYNETIESFVWLFNTFLTAMSGKHPSTIFTDQCAAMFAAIRIVFPNTRHRLCLWHIYQSAAKLLSHVINEHPEFLAEFKKCVYEERSVYYFNELWHELLSKYNLEENLWLNNLYGLRAHWAAVFHDSFTADMTSTQRSEGMNNVFNKRFRRKLCLSELIEECEKCAIGLRENELDADYKSRCTNPIIHIPHLAMLKTAAKSYTRKLYSKFEKEFGEQFSFTFQLLQSEGTVKTYKVMPTRFQDEATVVFNSEEMTITCSCRKYECIGMYQILISNALVIYISNSLYMYCRDTMQTYSPSI
ncbi:hypothetical protein BS78_09G061600 [Paspalum vaginatum]|nr:hypothetical protein BS78_09G061600 [Paspalum vaginatum]